MSPEQAEGQSDRLGPASDVYSLGATLYCLLTGRPPFEGGDVPRILTGVRTGSFPRPREVDRAIPAALEAICLKAMSLWPGDRYPSARGLAGEIDRWLADEPVSACRDPWPTRVSRWARRHKPLVAGAGALLITALVGLTIGIVAVKKEQRQTEAQRVALKLKSDALSRSVEALRRKDYISRVNLAMRECENDNIANADELLDGCPEDLRAWEWDYVKRQCHLELKTFPGTSAHVSSVAFSPDGKWIASGSGFRGPGGLVVRDVSTGRELFAHRDLQGTVDAVAFSPDGRWIASGGAYDLMIWDAATGQRRWLKTGLPSRVVKLKFSPDSRRIVGCLGNVNGLSTGSLYPFTGYVKLWDVASGSEVDTLPERRNGLCSLDLSPDGKQVALAGFPVVEIWDLEPVKLVRSLTGHDYQVVDVAFSPDGKSLASCGWDRTIKLWDRASGRELRTFGGQPGQQPNALRFSPDGSRLVIAGQDCSIRLWDLTTGRVLLSLQGHADEVRCLDYSPANGLLASGSGDGTLKVWYPTPLYQLSIKYRGGVGPSRLRPLSFSADGETILSASTDRKWSATTGESCNDRVLNESFRSKRLSSPDGTKSVAVSGNRIEIRERATGNVVRQFEVPHGGIANWVFSPNGSRIVTVGGTLEALVWDTQTGELLFELKGHSGRVKDVAYSPDGRRIATAGSDRTVKLWDAESGQEVFVLRGYGDGVNAIAFSPDGDRIVTNCYDSILRVWDRKPHDLGVLRRREMVALTRELLVELGARTKVVQALRTARMNDEFARVEALGLAENSDTIEGLWDLRGRFWQINGTAHSLPLKDVRTSIRSLQRTLAESESQAASDPGNLALQVELGFLHWHIGHLQRRAQVVEDCRTSYRKARDVFEGLARAGHEEDAPLRHLVALSYMTISWVEPRPRDRIGLLDKAREIIEENVRRTPRNRTVSIDLEFIEIAETYAFFLLKDYDRSLSLRLSARNHLKGWVEEVPDGLYFAQGMVGNDVEIGRVQRAMGRNAEAAATFQGAVREAESSMERFPGNPTIMDRLIDAGFGLGRIRESMGQAGAALEAYQTALGRVEGQTNLQAITLYNLACLDSLSSALARRVRGSRSQAHELSGTEYADRAMTWLRRSVAAGNRDLDHMKQDTDLDPLRSRPDFQELMMDLAFPNQPFAPR
jgi:WD40 repeat protein